MEGYPHHELDRAAERRVQAESQGSGPYAQRRFRLHALLGAARLRQGRHAQVRRLRVAQSGAEGGAGTGRLAEKDV